MTIDVAPSAALYRSGLSETMLGPIKNAVCKHLSMQLDTRDSRILEGFVAREAWMKRLGPIVLSGDVVAAVALYFFFAAEPWALWVSLALVVAGGMSVFVLMRVTDRGPGSAANVLSGRYPSQTVMATVADETGDAPYPSSLRLDGEVEYLHLSVTGTDLSLEPGERYRICGFGRPSAPFRGVVLLTGEDSPVKHWVYQVETSTSPQYMNHDV